MASLDTDRSVGRKRTELHNFDSLHKPLFVKFINFCEVGKPLGYTRLFADITHVLNLLTNSVTRSHIWGDMTMTISSYRVHAGGTRWHLWLCVRVRGLEGKWLELLTPNLADIPYRTAARHALTLRQKIKSHAVMKYTAGRVCIYVFHVSRFVLKAPLKHSTNQQWVFVACVSQLGVHMVACVVRWEREMNAVGGR